eukprot:TRINITY_DN15218_c0_g1_i1.p1 TRINITY_DN15218_c0_g1~~TRINITY_DN15218_c0_g1_i1.p1  ORF type:complete len:901 (+),score=102.44 TRINITY_DN15218_c0_g1_i1:18-2720(+)
MARRRVLGLSKQSGFSTLGGRAVRCLPAVALPLAVGYVRPGKSVIDMFSVVALVFGIAISVCESRIFVLVPATILGTAVLSSASFTWHVIGHVSRSHEDTAVDLVVGDRPGTESSPPIKADHNATAMDATPPRGDTANLGSLPWPVSLETFSIVLPCAYEGAFAAKTVNAIWRQTNQSRVKDIIIVDDGSVPPLVFRKGDIIGSPPVRMIRHEQTVGLIGAKKTGGNAARGDVIVFFDCHVSPRPGWEDAFLRQMRRVGDHRTVVVPTITSLDISNWQEVGGNSGGKACILLFNGDFPWYYGGQREVPIMSGGLLAMSRQWWNEIDGYDPLMFAWGGENIDQSLRTWLCGGRIELAEGAYVAHMWRDANKKETQLKYPFPTEKVMRNKARAVNGWLDEFKEKTFTFPEYEAFVNNRSNIGDMSFYDNVKKKRQCAPFSSYIRRFSDIYISGGLIPADVFQLRERKSGLCLQRALTASASDSGFAVHLASCADDNPSSSSSRILQSWHVAMRERGIMLWNFYRCLSAAGHGVRVVECDISGKSPSLHFKPPPPSGTGSFTYGDGGKNCVVPGKAVERTKSSTAVCTVTIERNSKPGFRIVDKQRNLCARSSGVVQEDGVSSPFEFGLCKDGDPKQVFFSRRGVGDSLLEIVDSSGSCLDLAGGTNALMYPCYSESRSNQNQLFQLHDERLTWQGPNSAFCVDTSGKAGKAKLRAFESPSSPTIFLAACAPKRGQRFVQDFAGRKEDGFLLRDVDSNKCLGSSGDKLTLVKCDRVHRWADRLEREQLEYIRRASCVDEAGGEKPIIYPCHRPRAQLTQQFRIVRNRDSVQIQHKGTWGDNGRKRSFDMCLDYAPAPDIPAMVVSCDEAQREGIVWERTGTHSSMEHDIWRAVNAKSAQFLSR